MNRKGLLAAGMLLIPAYAALSWGFGRATHASFDAWEQCVRQANSLVKVVEPQHTRHLHRLSASRSRSVCHRDTTVFWSA